MLCRRCSHDNRDSARFCAQCGRRLRASGLTAIGWMVYILLLVWLFVESQRFFRGEARLLGVGLFVLLLWLPIAVRPRRRPHETPEQ